LCFKRWVLLKSAIDVEASDKHISVPLTLFPKAIMFHELVHVVQYENLELPDHVRARFACLFGWSRTDDEDIHESSGALLPVRAGRDVGDADKGPK